MSEYTEYEYEYECGTNYCLDFIIATVITTTCIFVVNKYKKNVTNFTTVLISKIGTLSAKETGNDIKELQELSKQISKNKQQLCQQPNPFADSSFSYIRKHFMDLREDFVKVLQNEGPVFGTVKEIRSRILEINQEMAGNLEATMSGRRLKTRENFTQMREDGISVSIYNNETIKTLLLTVKSCMDKILAESSGDSKNILQKISTLIKSEEALYTGDPTATTTENTLLPADERPMNEQHHELLKQLRRQTAYIRTVHKILKFLDHKFFHIIKSSCFETSDQEDVSELLRSSRKDMISLSSKLKQTTQTLQTQSVQIGTIAAEMEVVTRRVKEFKDKGGDIENHIVKSARDVEDRVSDLQDDYSTSLNRLSDTLKQLPVKLQSVFQYVEEVEALKEFVDGIMSKCGMDVAFIERNSLLAIQDGK